jgi:hypothetical protein
LAIEPVAAMVAPMQNPDDDLIALGRLFDEAALIARAMIDAIPPDVSVQAEQAAIEAASGPPAMLAGKIAAMPARTPEGVAVKARAAAWLDGLAEGA